MRKTTRHGRKLKRLGITSSGQEKEVARLVTQYKLSQTIAMHKSYNDPTNVPDADRIMADVRLDLYQLENGRVPPDDYLRFYSLCDAIGSAQMRAVEIGGDNSAAMAWLNAAGRALRRCLQRRENTGRWGLDGPAIHELADGLQVYESILRESTPEQMRVAARRYVEWREATPKIQEPA